jgi:hypothetical protein
MQSENLSDLIKTENASCIPQETTITNVRLANAYVPFQKFCTTYTPEVSLIKGTSFPELYSPWAKSM